MGKVLTSGASGGVKSDDVTASKWDVVQGKNTITTDSDDEIVEGTLPDIVEDTQCTHSFQYVPANNYYLDFPQAAYRREDLTEPEKAGGRVFVTLDKLRQDIGYDDPLKVLPSAVIAGQAGTMPTQEGGLFLPSTVNQTVAKAQKYMNGDAVLSGDPNFVPENIRKNSIIFGVKGTFEGWVPEPTDLYYKGVVKDGILGKATFGDTSFPIWELERIHFNVNGRDHNHAEDIAVFKKAIDVTSYSQIILEGFIRRVSGYNWMYIQFWNGDDLFSKWSMENPNQSSVNSVSFNISQLSTIKVDSWFRMVNWAGGTYINRIRLM